MTQLPLETHIAGTKTVADWLKIKKSLETDNTQKVWKNAFCQFFKERLDTRYFDPIREIENMRADNGEGFAIVTLHCSLIEFLASTLEGKTYKYKNNGPSQQDSFEYSNSRDMFINFLINNIPFKGMFCGHEATDFYTSVRCGLLHEARTKNGWKIRVCSTATQAIDAKNKIIFRNEMPKAFEAFVSWYKQELLKSKNLQKAFIRKFDGLCEE